MIQISKSEYMLFLKHPAWLWLKKHDKAKLPPVDDNTQALFDTGFVFETYAEQLFPDGVRVGFDGYDEYLSLPKRTQEALQAGAKTIFQGRFEYERQTFICDVIAVIGDKEVDLYEIKSTTKAKPEHVDDLAFQVTVLEGCGFKVRNIAVIHADSEYVRSGDIDVKQFVATTDVTEKVKAKRAYTKAQIKEALAVVDASTIPDISPSHAATGCLKDWLVVYRSLIPVETDSIYDLASMKARDIGELESMGVTKLTDIPDNFRLTNGQRLQIQATKNNKALIDTNHIHDFLGELTYPLYFFDYETLSSIVPPWDGTKPYQQIPFQYSLHILDASGAELRHEEYLHRTNSNPAESLSQALKSHIGEHGSVMAWFMGFEKSCNTTLGKLAPKYAEFYANLNARVVDLMIPFSSDWYVDKGFHGSASIKDVLPVLVPELSYKELGIQEGGSAQRLWMEAVLDDKRVVEKDKILSDLVEYCKLDTLAMVEIYRKLLSL